MDVDNNKEITINEWISVVNKINASFIEDDMKFSIDDYKQVFYLISWGFAEYRVEQSVSSMPTIDAWIFDRFLSLGDHKGVYKQIATFLYEYITRYYHLMDMFME